MKEIKIKQLPPSFQPGAVDHSEGRVTFALDALYSNQKAVVYHRWNDEGDEVVVVLNFSPASQPLVIPFPHDANGLRFYGRNQ